MSWIIRVNLAAFAFICCFAGCASVEPRRDLASATEALVSDGNTLDFDTSIYADILSRDTGGKRLKYRMDFRFATDIEEEYLRTKARAAFQTALAKTLDMSNPQDEKKPLTERFKDHLLGALVSEFVKTLQVYKILNGTIQIDLTFLPENDDPGSFSPELSSNQLVRWDDVGTMADQFNALSAPNDVERLASYADHPVVQAQLNNSRYAYVGGSITLWLKLADMHFDIRHPIPNPFQNSVKGTVRLRRIFTAPTMDYSNIACKDGSIEKLTLQPEGVGRFTSTPTPKHQFVTVDHIKSFNLQQLVPRDESLEIYFGYLLPNHKGRKGLLAADDHKENPLKTGELVAYEKEGPFTRIKHRIGTLTWSYEKNGFDFSNSVIKSNVEENHVGEENPDIYALQNWLLRDCKPGLVESLGLDRFLPKGVR